MSLLGAIIAQTIRLSLRAGGGAIVGLVFFLAVITVIPFGVGPDLNLLSRIGPAFLWIGVLLASLLGLERLFSADREDGSLDLYISSTLSGRCAMARERRPIPGERPVSSGKSLRHHPPSTSTRPR